MYEPTETADVVIVGGGSAGAVLAARLSQDPARTVLLLEAGRAYAPDAYPPALMDANKIADPDHDWGYTSRGTGQAPQIPTPRGKVLGGSSAVNATVALRARAADFAKWGEHGAEGWTFDDVLPAFRLLENTPTGDDGHPTSTVPMGGSGDPGAVVDSAGAVKGVSGLRVADASIIPEVPSSTTNVTVIMLAERIYQRVYA